MRRDHASSASARRRGYTLVEVLIVVTVLGIAAAMAVPSLSQTGVFRVQAALRTIVSDITETQSEALAMQQARAIIFDADSSSYTIVRVPGTIIDPSVDALRSFNVNSSRFGDARMSNVDFGGGNTLVFDELGAPIEAPGNSTPASDGSLRISGSGQIFQILVQGYTGRVVVSRIEQPPSPPIALNE